MPEGFSFPRRFRGAAQQLLAVLPANMRSLETWLNAFAAKFDEDGRTLHYQAPHVTARGIGTDLTLTTATWTELDIWDAGSGMVDTHGLLGADDLTVTIPFDGLYLVALEVEFYGNGTGERAIRALHGDTRGHSEITSTSGSDNLTSAYAHHFLTGDTLVFEARQSSGGDLQIDNSECFMSVTKLSD